MYYCSKLDGSRWCCFYSSLFNKTTIKFASVCEEINDLEISIQIEWQKISDGDIDLVNV